MSFCKKVSHPYPDIDNWCGGTLRSGGWALVFINEKHAKTTDVTDTIIHESVHVWQQMVENIGEERPGIEMEAYSIAFIASTLLKEYSRLGKQDAVYAQRPQDGEVSPGHETGEPPVQLSTGTDQGPLGTDDSSPPV